MTNLASPDDARPAVFFEILTFVGRARLLVTIWFLRIAWLPTLAWGIVNAGQLAVGDLPPAAREAKLDDAVIRIGLGVVLFFLWLFGARRRGRWTMNAGGRLEDGRA